MTEAQGTALIAAVELVSDHLAMLGVLGLLTAAFSFGCLVATLVLGGHR